MKKYDKYDWQALDNISTLYSAITTYNNPNLYRMTVKLKEKIEKDLLIIALDNTLKTIPSFLAKLRKGFFWYYFEKNNMPPIVEMEQSFPYYRIDTLDNNYFLFKITYYEKKINIDISHMLADGTSTLKFLEVLVYNYLRLRHPKKVSQDNVIDLELLSKTEMKVDSFLKYADDNSNFSYPKKEDRSYAIKGLKLNKEEVNIIVGTLPLSKLKVLSKDKKVTITTYLTAILIKAIYEEKFKYNKLNYPIVICVPVDLRNYFNSSSMNNFFTYINISLDFFNNNYTFDDILSIISTRLKDELEPSKLISKFKFYINLQKNLALRFVPLFLKKVILRIGTNIVGKNNATAILSNVGIIKLPSELETFIERFEMITYPDKFVPLKIGMCSFGDKLTISLSSSINDREIERNFFRFLTNQNIDVSISYSFSENKQHKKRLKEFN